jgi:hypothetical protein
MDTRSAPDCLFLYGIALLQREIFFLVSLRALDPRAQKHFLVDVKVKVGK